MFEQKLLLENPMSRNVFDRVKDDSSSLIVLPDTASEFTKFSQSTENSSKMSRVFQFDAELINSRVYQRAIRSMVREAGHLPRKECKVLLLGARESGKETLMKKLKISHRNHNRVTEILCYKYTILSAVVDLMRKILLLLKSAGLESLVELSQRHANLVFQQKLPIDGMTPELAATIEHLWETIVPLLPCIRQVRDLSPLDKAAL